MRAAQSRILGPRAGIRHRGLGRRDGRPVAGVHPRDLQLASSAVDVAGLGDGGVVDGRRAGHVWLVEVEGGEGGRAGRHPMRRGRVGWIGGRCRDGAVRCGGVVGGWKSGRGKFSAELCDERVTEWAPC